jgi:hypothetical protein
MFDILHFKEIFYNLLPLEAYECALWAFGEGFEDLTPDLLPARWNLHHPDLFEIDPSNLMYQSIEKIIKSYRERSNEKS